MKDLIEMAARVAHETNRAWCEINGDMTQPTWDDAPDWQRDSAIKGIKFHQANPDADDSASHDSWTKQKIDDGWVFGKVKDPEAKTHHCLVPFEDLPKHQQIKDALFRSVAHQILQIKPTKASSLPVKGYTSQSKDNLAIVNNNKELEESILVLLDDLSIMPSIDKRWLSIGHTHIEQAFMAINRSVFKPKRVNAQN